MTRFTQNDVLDEVVDVFDPGLQLVVAVAIVDDKLLLLDSQQPGVSGRDVKRDRVQPRLTANPRPDAARHHGQQGAADDRGAIGQPAPHAALRFAIRSRMQGTIGALKEPWTRGHGSAYSAAVTAR